MKSRLQRRDAMPRENLSSTLDKMRHALIDYRQSPESRAYAYLVLELRIFKRSLLNFQLKPFLV